MLSLIIVGLLSAFLGSGLTTVYQLNVMPKWVSLGPKPTDEELAQALRKAANNWNQIYSAFDRQGLNCTFKVNDDTIWKPILSLGPVYRHSYKKF